LGGRTTFTFEKGRKAAFSSEGGEVVPILTLPPGEKAFEIPADKRDNLARREEKEKKSSSTLHQEEKEVVWPIGGGKGPLFITCGKREGGMTRIPVW